MNNLSVKKQQPVFAVDYGGMQILWHVFHGPLFLWRNTECFDGDVDFIPTFTIRRPDCKPASVCWYSLHSDLWGNSKQVIAFLAFGFMQQRCQNIPTMIILMNMRRTIAKLLHIEQERRCEDKLEKINKK